MLIPLLRVGNGFPNMAEARLIEGATAIHLAISTNPTVFSTPTVPMPDLLDAITAFADAVAALKAFGGGTKPQVDEKNNLKIQLVNILHQLSYYVLNVAQGNRNIALLSGFTIAKEPTPVVLTKPTNVQVTAGEQKGWLQVSVKRQPGVRSYQYQYTADPEQKEETWMTDNCTKGKCILKGLTPGQNYFIRVGIVGANDQVFVSEVTSRIAA